MELGHNILHGQWDWMRDPDIHSTTWEWDFVTPARSWQHTHNDLHHRWTNVVGKDNDIGYNLLRMDPDQKWTPFNLGNPLYNALLAPVFEWGIAIYDLELVDYKEGRKSKEALTKDLKALGRKALKQFTKDYAATPAVAMLTGSGKQALYGTLTANAVRNVWAHAVIFCGHFPEGTDTFTEEMVEGETRGDWYVRQMIGSANISGSKFMHLMTGNLSHQIEHHLFPDLPSNRYAEVAAEGAGDLQALRTAVHHGAAAEAGRLHVGQDLQAGPAAEEGLANPGRLSRERNQKRGVCHRGRRPSSLCRGGAQDLPATPRTWASRGLPGSTEKPKRSMPCTLRPAAAIMAAVSRFGWHPPASRPHSGVSRSSAAPSRRCAERTCS